MRSEAARENQKRYTREWKQRQTGTCRVCGAVTRYNGHGNRVSELCRVHGLEASSEKARKKRGTGELNSRILRYLREPRRVKDITEHFGISPSQASVTLHRLMKYGMVRRVRRGTYERVEQ